MHTKKRAHMLLACRTLLFFVFAMSGASLSARAEDAPKIHVLSQPIDLYAEVYYAQDLGLFKSAGLDVEITRMVNGGATAAALAGGSGDIAVFNPVQAAAAVSRGVPFTIVAGAGMYTTLAPSTAICVTKSSPLQTARDLEGKTIALASINDLSAVALKKWLGENGADPTKVHIIEMTDPEMISALSAGRIDAATLAEPWQTIARSGNNRLFAKPLDAIAPEFNIGVLVATRGWAQAHPDLVQRFTNVIYAAAKWANTHHAESAQILAKYAKVDPNTLRTMIRVVYSTDLETGHIQPALDAAYQFHLMDKPVKASDLIWKAGSR
jgi:NitT/TauT family transport system substrate-binding protein